MNRRELFRAVLALPVAATVPRERPHVTISDCIIKNNKVYGSFSFGLGVTSQTDQWDTMTESWINETIVPNL